MVFKKLRHVYMVFKCSKGSSCLHNFSAFSRKRAAGLDSTSINTKTIHKTLYLIFADILLASVSLQAYIHLIKCTHLPLHQPTTFYSVSCPVGMPHLLFLDLLKMSPNRLCKDNKEWFPAILTIFNSQKRKACFPTQKSHHTF